MAKGYWDAKKDVCNFCGDRDIELRKAYHRTVICKKCAERNKYNWDKLEKMKQGWFEVADPLLGKARRHSAVAVKKKFEKTLRHPHKTTQLDLTLSIPPKSPRRKLSDSERKLKAEKQEAHRLFKIFKSRRSWAFSEREKQVLQEHYGLSM